MSCFYQALQELGGLPYFVTPPADTSQLFS